MICLIVDDEPIAREILEDYAADTPGLTVAASCSSALQALEFLNSESVDLLFLDVNMPKLSGIDLIKTLENPPLVILTTAYPDYALESYELDVTDYLLKPFSFERFLKAVQKAEAKRIKVFRDSGTIIVRADRKTWPVRHDEILFIESIGDYVIMHTDGKKITVHETLKAMGEMLPDKKFMRVHKSYIICVQAIDYIEGNIITICGHEIPVGKTYREQLIEWLWGVK